MIAGVQVPDSQCRAHVTHSRLQATQARRQANRGGKGVRCLPLGKESNRRVDNDHNQNCDGLYVISHRKRDSGRNGKQQHDQTSKLR